MKEALSFDDVNIIPRFSFIKSRGDVNVTTNLAGTELGLGIISSNMDTVTGPAMSKAMLEYGAGSCLHRFCSIEDNVKMFKESITDSFKPWVSIGLGTNELDRAFALIDAGAEILVIDVAHGATIETVNQFHNIKSKYYKNIGIVVGNFATKESILAFNFHSKFRPEAYKVGIGGGSACTTRQVTGCGVPSFTSLQDCVSSGYDIIQDGGIKNSGDFAKSMALGAKAVMLGRLLAGAEESPAQLSNGVTNDYTRRDGVVVTNINELSSGPEGIGQFYKKYRGSASAESYEVQGKVAAHRTAEGESYLIPYTGPVKGTLQTLEAGLRSSMSYVGARNLEEFKENAEFIKITHNGYVEGTAYGAQ